MNSILKVKFLENIQPLQAQVEKISKDMAALDKIRPTAGSLEHKYQILALAGYYLSLCELNLEINTAYYKLARKNSDVYLDNARKNLSSIVTKAEAAFSIRVITPEAGPAKGEADLKEFTPARIYHTVFRMNKNLLALRQAYPVTSPISETVRRLYRDLTGFSVSLTNFKKWYPLSKDLRSPYYEDVSKLFRLIIDMMESSAEMIMESYNINKNKDSAGEAVAILEHLEGLQRLLNDPSHPETARKKESWMRFL